MPEFQVARSTGKAATEWVAKHDIVMEASISVGSPVFATAGVATVNSTDKYIFFGGGYAYSLAPASMSLSIGTVENYTGEGSYGGFFTSVTPQPAGLTIAGNPMNPKGPVALSFTMSTDVGVSQAMTFYVPMNQLSQDLQDKLNNGAAYVFVQGDMYKLTPP
jgi:hypothetical protein